MKLYEHSKQTYQDGEVSHTWQFGIINDISLLWVNFESPGNVIHSSGGINILFSFFDKMRYGVDDYVKEIDNVLGDELLTPHMSYLSLVNKTKKYVNGIAHITGGGFYDNIPRILPKNLNVVIDKKSWDIFPIFKFIQKCGKVSDDEMYHVFNMGIGMVFIMNKKYVDKLLYINWW